MTLWLMHKYPGLILEEQESGYLSLENLGTSALCTPAATDTLILDHPQRRWCLVNRRVLREPHPNASTARKQLSFLLVS